MFSMRRPSLDRAAAPLTATSISNGLARSASAGGLRIGGQAIARKSSLPQLAPCGGRQCMRPRPESKGRQARQSVQDKRVPSLVKQEAPPASRTSIGASIERSQTAAITHDAKPQCPLQPGAAVRIGDRLFNIDALLGSGGFGTVWSAGSIGLGPVAIKEIDCKSSAALLDAVRESKLLIALSQGASALVACQLPSLIAREVASVDSDRWQVRLAMTRVRGVSLRKFLSMRRPSSHRGRDEIFMDFSQAVGFSRELLAQLAPVFEHISQLVYHRDVNPQNIMIDDAPGGPRFGLIDFGLATDAATWRGDVNSGSPSNGSCLSRLQRCGVVGHGCYWPTSAWLAFSHGAEELSRRPDLLFEFGSCLDFHALGLVALQLLVERLAGVASQNDADCSDLLLSKLSALEQAWQRYWHDVSSCWRRVVEASRRNGDIAVLQASFVRLSVHKIVRRDLRALHAALSEASAACSTAPAHLGLAAAPGLMDTILMLISGAERASGYSPCDSWKRVKLCVGVSDVLPLPRTSELSRPASSEKTLCAVFPPSPSPSTATPPSSPPCETPPSSSVSSDSGVV